jgi:hypothetical protein
MALVASGVCIFELAEERGWLALEDGWCGGDRGAALFLLLRVNKDNDCIGICFFFSSFFNPQPFG